MEAEGKPGQEAADSVAKQPGLLKLRARGNDAARGRAIWDSSRRSIQRPSACGRRGDRDDCQGCGWRSWRDCGGVCEAEVEAEAVEMVDSGCRQTCEVEAEA
jgi:hypothetical protein